MRNDFFSRFLICLWTEALEPRLTRRWTDSLRTKRRCRTRPGALPFQKEEGVVYDIIHKAKFFLPALRASTIVRRGKTTTTTTTTTTTEFSVYPTPPLAVVVVSPLKARHAVRHRPSQHASLEVSAFYEVLATFEGITVDCFYFCFFFLVFWQQHHNTTIP